MNSSPSPVVHASQRAWDYWFTDGLTNLIVGTGCVLLSFCILYPPHWPPSPLRFGLWALALFLYLSLNLRHRHILEWLKARTTYPRTGYAQPPADDTFCLTTLKMRPGLGPEESELRASRRRTNYVMLGMIVIASLVMIVAIRRSWVWIAASLIIAAAMIVARKLIHVSWIVPIGFAVLGFSMTFFPPPRDKASAIFLLGWGLIFLLDGGTTLLRYILQNPAPGKQAPTA